MTIRKTATINNDEIQELTEFFTQKGFKKDFDFFFENISSENNNTSTLILKRTDNKNNIFEIYDEVCNYCFLIRLAKTRTQSKFDICRTFQGTIAQCKEFIKTNYDLASYMVKHCDFDYDKGLNLSEL